MDYDTLIKDIDTKLKPLYLIYGEEQYLVQNALSKIKKNFGEKVLGINYVLLDESSINEIIPNIQMPAFGYEKKLIVVKNSGLFKKDGRKKSEPLEQEQISDFIKNNMDIISDSIVLVFIEEKVDKNSVYEQIEKNGIITCIQELKAPQLVQKLKQIASMYKVKIDDRTANYLIEVSGTSMQNLINEIRKLIEYVGENGTINIDDVEALATKQIDSVIFELTDNLATRKIDKAIDVLDNLIYQKEPLQKILITLYNHFKKLYLCTIALSLNKDTLSVLNLKPNQTFLVSKYKKQSSYFNKNVLKEILNAFIELDYNSKIGKIDLDIGLRSVLCRYCS